MTHKNVIITGASGGIGRALLNELAKYENVCVTAFTRNKKALLKDYEENKDRLIVNELDFTHDEFAFLATKYLYTLPFVDVLINNAAILINKPFELLTKAEIDEIIQINLTGTMLITQICLPKLQKSQSAHVVNVSSMAGFQGSQKYPGLSVYSATKAGLNSFTEVMAEEYQNKGVYFNALSMGAVETPMFQKAFSGAKAPRTAENAATFIVDFALNQRSFFNGKIIPVTTSTP